METTNTFICFSETHCSICLLHCDDW